MTQTLPIITQKVTQIQESHTHLIAAITDNTDERRWDAYHLLLSNGYNSEEISLACGYASPNALAKWKYRNKHKYGSRIIGSTERLEKPKSKKPPSNYEDLDTYGIYPPQDFISALDHYSWGRKYAPAFSGWGRLGFMDDIAQELWDKYKILIEAPRDHGKTWTIVKLFVRWLLEKRTKVICVATQAKKDEMFQAVLDILTSDEIRQDYGDVVERSSSTKGKIWFVDELRPTEGANFSIHGAESFITGLHATGGWLHLEDIVQELKVAEAAEKRLRFWFKRTVRYIAGVDTKLSAVGTRKSIDDIYGWFVKEYRFPLVLHEALIVESGRLPTIDEIQVDHERELILEWEPVGVYRSLDCPNFPMGRLLYEFIFHPVDASAELNNNPLPYTGAYFDGDEWIEEDLDEMTEVMRGSSQNPGLPFNTYIFVDPAFGGSRTSSKTGILVFAIIQKRLWIIDAYLGQPDFDQKEELIIDFWTTYAPLQTWIEDNFNQMSRSFSQSSRLTRLPGLHLLQSTTDKKERIASLKFPYSKKEIVVSSTIPFKLELKSEYLSFAMDDTPLITRTRYNLLDTLSMAYLKLRPHIGIQPSRLNSSSKTRSLQSNTRRIFE